MMGKYQGKFKWKTESENVFTDTERLCHQNHNRHNSEYLKTCTEIKFLSCPTGILKIAKLLKKIFQLSVKLSIGWCGKGTIPV